MPQLPELHAQIKIMQGLGKLINTIIATKPRDGSHFPFSPL
jgi:hypothetical protein